MIRFPIRLRQPTELTEAVSLDALIAQARELGAIRIWQSSDLYDNPRENFDVAIKFRVGHSVVEAKSSHSSLEFAIEAAIAAGRRLKNAG